MDRRTVRKASPDPPRLMRTTDITHALSEEVIEVDDDAAQEMVMELIGEAALLRDRLSCLIYQKAVPRTPCKKQTTWGKSDPAMTSGVALTSGLGRDQE